MPQLIKRLEDGAKVKLRTSRIKKHPDFRKLEKEYQRFITHNKNTVFEVVNDDYLSLDHSMVLLKKDGIVAKWLIYIDNLKEVG